VNFSLQGVPSLPITVTAGTQRTFQVEFQAATPGPYQDLLIVSSNDARRGEVRNGIQPTFVP
jgi:hypothetical protein